MSSIIEGHSYDIFISYRQKDNKYDGWVSEFVDNLKKELESTFKEEVSVYFDINPHNGLLETHDVDESLKEKLKCLIFIPIISRTYCDPKSFAWEHEFKAFIEQASQDQFGLKIKLPGGNVASRVLPVQIHDLDEIDIKECESVLGGFLRGVEFIYKTPGVNRPLRAKEENPNDNLSHTIYRDQINKVSLALKDIIESIKSGISEQGAGIRTQKLSESEMGKTELSEKDNVKKISKENPKCSYKTILLRKRILIPVIIVFLIVCTISAILISHLQNVKWSKEEALPEIERLLKESKIPAAFNLLQKAGKFIPEDPEYKNLVSQITKEFTILTDPPGADVTIREYSDSTAEWMKIGKTPVDRVVLPSQTFYIVKFQKESYEDVIAVTTSLLDTLSRTLFKKGEFPPQMVYVEGYWDEWKNTFKKNNGFFMDRYEVTNKQFKEFIDKGGYKDTGLWKNEFIRKGRKLSWNEAMAIFIDKTGRSGPSTWEGGTYPEGQDNFPVSGVSWYEAAAYAEFAGKSLPTADHWDSGAGFFDVPYYNKIGGAVSPFSNFNKKGTESIDKNRALTAYGAYDMSGSVREWCWNEGGLGHIVAGGGWSDSYNSFTSWSTLSSFDRSPENGFRCVIYTDRETIPESAFRYIDMAGARDYSKERPVPYETFLVFRRQFLYKTLPLLAIVEERNDTSENWTIEKISFTAAYNEERVIAYLYLPKKFTPPFQTLIYFPGTPAVYLKDLKESQYVRWFGEFLLKSGRAVLFPVYKGTFQRNDGLTTEMSSPNHSHEYTEWLIKWVKDFSRSIDYLETRSDIDIKKIGFYGISWGGILGGIIPAVEKRLALNIMLVGGFCGTNEYPEADAINYVSRITIPTLMLNGKNDSRFPLETAVLPFWNLLSTPEKDKRLCVYENPTDHVIPEENVRTEMLNFLDKYFGPVNYQTNK